MKIIPCPLMGSCILAGCTPQKTEEPNIIFILTDDQGYVDMGIAGHSYSRIRFITFMPTRNLTENMAHLSISIQKCLLWET